MYYNSKLCVSDEDYTKISNKFNILGFSTNSSLLRSNKNRMLVDFVNKLIKNSDLIKTNI